MDESDNRPTAQNIEDGSYFKAARTWYSTLFHTPIAERSYYIVIIVLAFINGFFAVNAFMEVFPVRPAIPFITYSDDVWEDLPRIKRITAPGEDKNVAVMKWLVKSYVENRESYDLKSYEWRYRNIWTQSAPDVFAAYKSAMDTANPYSPYRLYTNKIRRVITIDALKVDKVADSTTAHVVFEAALVADANDQEISRSKWQADMVFKYTDFTVNQQLSDHVWLAHLFGLTGDTPAASGEMHRVTPMTFMVSYYQAKEFLE